ncbi:trypco2 family protein [Photobacterium leiognathi]|uniref:trypco2 family protein n=1 Tax=Photobacterium leiognathi TaxID=553611 RepID=UPI0027355B7F|nr:trypco2 family protein [Photobacterium leiognathi]
MKGNISLKEFIDDVKKELMEASESDSPFFTMDEVELEVSFGLNAKGKAGGKFVVFELGAETNASQMHKVKLKLTPYKNQEVNEAAKKSNLRVTNPQKPKAVLLQREKRNDTVKDKQKENVVTCNGGAVKSQKPRKPRLHR